MNNRYSNVFDGIPAIVSEHDPRIKWKSRRLELRINDAPQR